MADGDMIILDDDMGGTSPVGRSLFVGAPEAPDSKSATAPSSLKATTPKGEAKRGGLSGRRKLRSVTTKGGSAAQNMSADGEVGHDLEADELHAMELAVEVQQQALREKKDRFKKRQQQQMHRRADELQARLKALEEAEKQERRVRLNMRTKLTGLREHDAEDQDEEKELAEQLWTFERDSQIEELTRMKMQIQQIQLQREKTEARMDANTVQVTALEDVLLSRGNADFKKLQAILNNADTLKESLLKGELERDSLFKDEERRGMATQVLEGTKGEGSNDAFKLSDEVEMRRRKEREQRKQERQEKLRELNEQRKKINDQQIASVKQEKDHRLLMERGLELLVDIELGVAPPLKYILDNARDGDEEIVVDSDIESDEERETFLNTIQHNMTYGPKIISALEKEREELDKEKQWAKGEHEDLEPYAGELGPKSYHPDQLPSFRICISIVEDLAKRVTEQLVHRPTIKDVDREVQNIHNMRVKRAALREEDRIDRCVRLLNTEMVSEVVHDLAGSICVEYNEVHKRAKGNTKDLLIEAFDVSPSVRPMLMPVLSELIKRRDASDEQHDSRIAHHTTKLKVASMGNHKSDSLQREKDGKKGGRKVGGSKEDVMDKHEAGQSDEVDYDTTLVPDSDEFIHALRGDTSLTDMEDDYWGKFDLTWEGHDLPPKAGPVTVACLSANNRYLFTGHKKGAVLFWDCCHAEPLLIRQNLRENVPKEDQLEIIQACFGSGGGGSRVATLDQAHVIRLWTTEVDSSGNNKKKKESMFPADYHTYAKKPKSPQLILVLKAKHFARGGADPENLMPLEPTFINFHVAMTITGQTPSMMCGLRGGVMVKYNINSDGPVLFDEPIGADIKNPVTAGKSLETEERMSRSRLAASGNVTRPDTVREFFQAHRHEVEFIGNVGTSKDTHDPTTKMVSVDVTGRIFMWPYNKASYSGFGWFIPSAKYKVRSRYEGGKHPIKISVVEVTMNTSRTQLLILVHAKPMDAEELSDQTKSAAVQKDKEKLGAGNGDMEILIFDLHTAEFSPRSITVDPKTAMTKTPPAMGMGPIIDCLGSDYCFIIHDGIIRIISMNTNHIVRDEAKSIPSSQRSKADTSGSLLVAHDFSRIYYIGHNGTQIREAICQNKNTHIHRRELAVVSRLQLAWQDDERLIRLHTAAAEQRARGFGTPSAYWDIMGHNVFREIQGTVLEIVASAIDISEEGNQMGKPSDAEE